jgi:hypothetical protein
MPVQFPLILLSVVTELLQQLVSLVAAHILLHFSMVQEQQYLPLSSHPSKGPKATMLGAWARPSIAHCQQ